MLSLNLKQLKERRIELLNFMNDLTENIEVFNSVKFNEYKEELLEVENRIKEFDNSKEIIINKNEIERKCDKMKDFKNQLMSGKEINLNEMKNIAHTTGNTEDLIQDTYAEQIERKLRDKCLLYDKARKVVTASPHIIPVEVTALDKFLPVAELGQYAEQQASFGQVKLGAVKYGTMLQVSEELLQDEDYNLEAILMDMLQEAFEETVLDLIVKGNSVENIEGLAMAQEYKGAKKVAVADGIIEDDDIIDLMFALDRPYRENAVFIMRDDVARQLCKLKDEEGRPLLQLHANDKAFLSEGADGVLKGKQVIICDALPQERPLMFVDMHKAMVVGVRKGMTIKKSEEAGFMHDAVYIKANVRLDAKLLLQEAIAFIEV